MNTTSGKPKSIRIDLIRTDGGTQSREEIDRAVVEDYSRSIADLPPVVVFFDGTDYWLSDGFHRLEAHLMVNAEYIDCDVHQGSVRDAILHSVSANARHGVRRTNADKRRAVLTMLADEEWRKWSDGKIADQCGVSQPFVGSVRGELTQNRYESERTYTTRHGTTATMNVANIGTNKAPAVAPTFGTINTDDEPTAADDDNARPEPDEDEIERKAANKRFIENAPMQALAEAASVVDAMSVADRVIAMLRRIDMRGPNGIRAIEAVRDWTQERILAAEGPE